MTTHAFPLDAVAGAPAYTGRMLRTALSALVGNAPAGRPLGATTGVRPGTPTTTVSVAGSTWTVAPHSGVLDVEAAPEAGPYLYAITASETGAVNAAHATWARWDGIYVQLDDPAEGDGTSVPEARVVYVAGTAAASPAMPAAPARSLLLARIVVPQSGGGASSVVWLAQAWDDTGWVALPVTGFSGGTTAARYRQVGKAIYFEFHGSGFTSIAAGAGPAGGSVSSTQIPADMRPTAKVPLAAISGAGAGVASAFMNVNGLCAFANTSAAAITEAHISGSWVK